MADCAPFPMATSVITADTPMIMPSIVRPVRILFRLRALKAMRNVMTGDIVLPPAAASATSAAAAIAAPDRASESTATEAATAGLPKRRKARGCWTRRVCESHIGDELCALLQIAVDQ